MKYPFSKVSLWAQCCKLDTSRELWGEKERERSEGWLGCMHRDSSHKIHQSLCLDVCETFIRAGTLIYLRSLLIFRMDKEDGRERERVKGQMRERQREREVNRSEHTSSSEWGGRVGNEFESLSAGRYFTPPKWESESTSFAFRRSYYLSRATTEAVERERRQKSLSFFVYCCCCFSARLCLLLL